MVQHGGAGCRRYGRRVVAEGELPGHCMAFAGQGEQVSGTGLPFSILVVDDDPAITRMLEEALTLEGMLVEVAFNGQEAVDRLQATPMTRRLLLLDIGMPIMDGTAVIRWLVEHPEIRSHVTIVIMTANHLLAQYAHLDHDGVLGKPFGMDSVLTLIAAM